MYSPQYNQMHSEIWPSTYYVDTEMDDNSDEIKIDLVGIPNHLKPQVSITYNDTCEDCCLKTNLIVTYCKSDELMVSLTRWTEYYNEDPSQILDQFFTFWNVKKNTIVVTEREQEYLLSNFFQKPPQFLEQSPSDY